MRSRILLNTLLCTFFLAMPAFEINAQPADSVHIWRVRGNAQYGLLLPEYGFMSLNSDNYLNGFEINILRQTSGKNIYEHLYRFPAVGLSFYYSSLGSKDIFGQQYALYPYYAVNIIRKPRFNFCYQMGVGVAWATKSYDQFTNYENLAIGSHFNIHFHTDFIAEFKINERNSFEAGMAFAHISNANLSEPNVGLNWWTATAGFSYALKKTEKPAAIRIENLKPYNWYEISFNGGMKHTRTFESFQYPAVSLSFDFKRRTGYKFAFGAGADIFYDAAVEPQMKRLMMNYKPSDSWMTGIHLAQEFVYNRVSFILQEGLYLGLKEKLNGYFMYNRAMFRYRFSDHFYVSTSMKSHLYILDFPEIGVGYYWR